MKNLALVQPDERNYDSRHQSPRNDHEVNQRHGEKNDRCDQKGAEDDSCALQSIAGGESIELNLRQTGRGTKPFQGQFDRSDLHNSSIIWVPI
jgi:hypothetical protein